MNQPLEISLLGELRVACENTEIALPASRKTRALLAFLVGTGRPHRRERLCELFWDLPDDPKASLRWSLSKLRKIVDAPEQPRIIADRERVYFDTTNVVVDTKKLRTDLVHRKGHISTSDLELMAHRLDAVLLDGLDGAGVATFDDWLLSERQDVHLARMDVLRQLATQQGVFTSSSNKWLRLWKQADSDNFHSYQQHETADSDSSVPGDKQGKRADHTQRVKQRSEKTSMPRPSWAITSDLREHAAQALRAQKIRFCEVSDGTRIAYATLGSGAPILKAANWLNHLEFDWDSPIWGNSFAELARHRTFIRYDERGCGLSDWDVKDLSFNAFVEDLEAVADKLELERFPLLGISQGCAVAIEYAVRHPERVSGLILFGGYATGWRYHANPQEIALRETMMTLTELGWGQDNPAYRQVFSQTFMPEATSNELDWFNEFQRLTTSPGNAARFQDAFGHIDVRDRLADVKAPTIVLHSRHDQRIPIELARAIARGIPDAHFVPLESGNHILVDHEPALKVCFDAVKRFMKEKGI